jgi:hypothetical protein
MHLQDMIRFTWTWIEETLTQYRIDEGKEPPMGERPKVDYRVSELPKEAREILVPLEWPCFDANTRTIEIGEYAACDVAKHAALPWLKCRCLVDKIRDQAPARAAEARELRRQSKERHERQVQERRENEALRRRREEEREAREAREAEERESAIYDWVVHHGTESQRERLGAGVLPLTEALDAMRDSLYEPLAKEARFQRLKASEIEHQDYCGVHAASHAEWDSYEASEVTDEEWQRIKALSHLMEGAECEVVEHRGTCRACDGTATRRSIRVAVYHGPIRFTREYAI